MALQIAVLFDAENIGADLVKPVLTRLTQLGTLHSRRAIGDFSGNALSGWLEQGRHWGVELVMQPSLGRGKNSADITLTIEAMELALRGGVDTIALVSKDRDFTPLALRLRHHGLTVLGFGGEQVSPAFKAACTRYEPVVVSAVVANPVSKAPVATASSTLSLNKADHRMLVLIVHAACEAAGGPIDPAQLRDAIVAEDRALATKLSGTGKFLKTLVGHGIVERVGSGPNLKVRLAKLKLAS